MWRLLKIENPIKKAPISLEYTHCEINKAMIFGYCSSYVPFANHNQATKITLQAAMSKQAVGMSTTNYQSRFDIIQNDLFYPQQPIVTTRTKKHTKTNVLPVGQNAIAALAVFTGYNQ